ncbi:MAG: hypothetical protein LIO65_06915 [Odoribacter sp.]|nr:hypothetical protein [Odoribacter sp.]
MLYSLKFFFSFVVILFLMVGCNSHKIELLTLPEDTTEALKKYSIRFDSVVNSYYSGGLIGNGRLGAAIYKEKGDTLCWELGCTEVVDHRPTNGTDDILYTRCRLPIGKILLPLNGENSDMVMDLYEADVKGKFGKIEWRSFTPATENVLIIEVQGEGELPDFDFRPEISQSPRTIYEHFNHNIPVGYMPNPEPIVYKEGDYHICKQSLLAGGEYTTVWKIEEKQNRKLLILAIGYSQTDTTTEQEAIKDIEKVLSRNLSAVKQEHLNWWHDFYSRSYISVGEDKYDAFFWSQIYKLGSATRIDGLPIDLMGPWYHNRTPWPAIWWNLNIQLTYSPLFAVNRADLALPLCNMLDRNVENLKKNVPAAYKNAAAIGRASSYDCIREVETEHGLLMWTLFYYWKYCIYENDEVKLKEDFFPLLKLAVNYYIYLLEEGKDGYYHLPESFSPEYKSAVDCNFELALLRWGCQTLIKTDKHFGINDESLSKWQRIEEKLVPYPMDEDGFLIGKEVKLTSGHRHYSHLLMVYPLDIFPTDTPENAEIVRKSILYWLGFSSKSFYTGYTYTGAASMYTILGDGEEAYNNLSVMLDKYLEPNTLYKEAGPVFETPMSGLASFTEMLLLSKDSLVNVFPALPAHWKDIHYRGLRTEGGFEVSAQKINGITEKIELKSLYGKPCILKCDIPIQNIVVEGASYIIREDGKLRIQLAKDDVAVIKRK